MKYKALSLLLPLLMAMCFVNVAGTAFDADSPLADEASTDIDQINLMSIPEVSPQVYRKDGALVFEGFKDTVINPSLYGITLDAVTNIGAGDSDKVFTTTYTDPVVISSATNVTITGSVFNNINDNYALQIIGGSDIKIVDNEFSLIVSDDNNRFTTVDTDLEVIKVSNSPGFILKDNEFSYLEANGTNSVTLLSLTTSDDSIISNNVVNNYEVTDTEMDFIGFDISLSDNLTISSNSINNVEANNFNFMSIVNAHNSTITGNSMNNAAVGDTMVDFVGYDISSSDNMTLVSNSATNLKADQASFMSIADADNITYYGNQFSYSTINSGTGFSISNTNNLTALSSNVVSYLTIGDGSGFTAFMYDTVADVYEYSQIQSIPIQSGDFIGYKLNDVNNFTQINSVMVSVVTYADRIIGYEITASTDVNLTRPYVLGLYSFAVGIDLDNSQSIYGAYINGSTGVVINWGQFTNYDSNSQVFGFYTIDSHINSWNNLFYYFEGSIIHGLVIIRGLAGTVYNDSNFAQWYASQIFGIEIYNTTTSMVLYDFYFSQISYTTYGNGLIMKNSSDIIINQLTFVYIYSYAPFFDTSLVRFEDSHNITLMYAYMYYIVSYYTQIDTISTYNVSNSDFIYNSIIFNRAFEAAIVALRFTNSNNLNISLNYLNYIKSFATVSLQLDILEDEIGYGFVLENTNSTVINNNSIYVTDLWYSSDAKSTDVSLAGNTIDNVEDYVTSFTKPDDLLYDADIDAGATLNWTATTLNATLASNYTIYLDGELVQEGNWTSGSPISYEVSGLGFGVYIVTIDLIQSNGFITTDVVIITASELTAPVISNVPDDLVTVANEGSELSWQVFERNPSSYSIYRGDIEIDYGFYIANDTITYSLQDAPLGIHTYTITVRDEAGNEASDSVVVEIVEASPITINYATDEITYEVGSANNSIDFTVSGTIGGDFVVSLNGLNFDTGSWISDQEINYNITGLDVGQYLFGFFIIDEVGNLGDFEVVVNVVPVQDIDDEGETDEGGGIIQQFDNVLENIPDVGINSDNIIPLAIAAFGGGAVFFPGMKIIRKRVGKK